MVEPGAEDGAVHLDLDGGAVPPVGPIEGGDGGRRRMEGDGSGGAGEVLGGELGECRLHPLIPTTLHGEDGN